VPVAVSVRSVPVSVVVGPRVRMSYMRWKCRCRRSRSRTEGHSAPISRANKPDLSGAGLSPSGFLDFFPLFLTCPLEFWFLICDIAIQLTLQLQEERIKACLSSPPLVAVEFIAPKGAKSPGSGRGRAATERAVDARPLERTRVMRRFTRGECIQFSPRFLVRSKSGKNSVMDWKCIQIREW